MSPHVDQGHSRTLSAPPTNIGRFYDYHAPDNGSLHGSSTDTGEASMLGAMVGSEVAAGTASVAEESMHNASMASVDIQAQLQQASFFVNHDDLIPDFFDVSSGGTQAQPKDIKHQRRSPSSRGSGPGLRPYSQAKVVRRPHLLQEEAADRRGTTDFIRMQSNDAQMLGGSSQPAALASPIVRKSTAPKVSSMNQVPPMNLGGLLKQKELTVPRHSFQPRSPVLVHPDAFALSAARQQQQLASAMQSSTLSPNAQAMPIRAASSDSGLKHQPAGGIRPSTEQLQRYGNTRYPYSDPLDGNMRLHRPKPPSVKLPKKRVWRGGMLTSDQPTLRSSTMSYRYEVSSSPPSQALYHEGAEMPSAVSGHAGQLPALHQK